MASQSLSLSPLAFIAKCTQTRTGKVLHCDCIYICTCGPSYNESSHSIDLPMSFHPQDGGRLTRPYNIIYTQPRFHLRLKNLSAAAAYTLLLSLLLYVLSPRVISYISFVFFLNIYISYQKKMTQFFRQKFESCFLTFYFYQ